MHSEKYYLGLVSQDSDLNMVAVKSLIYCKKGVANLKASNRNII